jgi:hypothetical protein
LGKGCVSVNISGDLDFQGTRSIEEQNKVLSEDSEQEEEEEGLNKI